MEAVPEQPGAAPGARGRARAPTRRELELDDTAGDLRRGHSPENERTTSARRALVKSSSASLSSTTNADLVVETPPSSSTPRRPRTRVVPVMAHKRGREDRTRARFSSRPRAAGCRCAPTAGDARVATLFEVIGPHGGGLLAAGRRLEAEVVRLEDASVQVDTANVDPQPHEVDHALRVPEDLAPRATSESRRVCPPGAKSLKPPLAIIVIEAGDDSSNPPVAMTACFAGVVIVAPPVMVCVSAALMDSAKRRWSSACAPLMSRSSPDHRARLAAGDGHVLAVDGLRRSRVNRPSLPRSIVSLSAASTVVVWFEW